MKTAIARRAGVATDAGITRAVNEDRVLADEARGIFLVVDGLGGHAAGELAAETALRIIEKNMAPGSLNDSDAGIEEQIRRSITEANNQIYALAQGNEEYRGMACVLTLVVARDDRVTVGHVGDSRLYLAWNGTVRKLTSDHSPVGEREDRGELTEEEAMRHPRRNEVFRDVGSRLREPNDSEFVEIRNFLFRPDAALLLCSDGLSDVLRSGEISAIVERYDGDPDRVAHELVNAANDAGGKDNVSVVFVAGPEFLGSESNTLVDVRSRHAITRMRSRRKPWRGLVRNMLWLLTGMLLGIPMLGLLERMVPRPAAPQPAKALGLSRGPAHILVNPAEPLGIVKALSIARDGDIVEVPAGEYLGPIQLKEHVNLIGVSKDPSTIRGNPTSATDPGVAISARGIRDARIERLRIVGDEAHPLRTGIWMADSSIEIDDVEISGAIEAGIRIDGDSRGTLLANFIHANPGAGIAIKDRSAPRLAGNWISENGWVIAKSARQAARRGIEIDSSAEPILLNNVVARNGLPASGAN